MKFAEMCDFLHKFVEVEEIGHGLDFDGPPLVDYFGDALPELVCLPSAGYPDPPQPHVIEDILPAGMLSKTALD